MAVMRRHLIAILTVVAAFGAAVGPAAPVLALPVLTTPPANDDPAGAQRITGRQGELDVSFEHATSDPDDPPETYDEPSLWYRWTAPASGWYQFTLLGVDQDCFGATAVYQGESLDSLERRSHRVDEPPVTYNFLAAVHAVEDETYTIAAASSCTYYGPLTLQWEQRGPLIVTVVGPDGTSQPGVGVMEVDCTGETCWDGEWSAQTEADGRAYFHIPTTAYGETHTFELRPRSMNQAKRYVDVTLPAKPTADAVTATRSLRANPSVDLDRDGLGDIVSGVPLADRGAVNAGAVVVQFGNGRRRVIDQDSAGVPSGRARGEQFGAAVVADDVNGDGWPDLTIGAPGEMVGSVRAGAVFIVLGSPKGLGNGPRTVRMHQGQRSVAGGAKAGDRFGAAVAPVRTYYYTHFLVGVPGKDSSGKVNAGAVVRVTKFPVRDVQVAPSQVWHQDRSGVGGSNVAGDRFGSALAIGGFGWRNPSVAIGVPGKNVQGARDAGAIVVLVAINAARDYASSGNPLIHQNKVSVVPGEGAKPGNAFGSALVSFGESDHKDWYGRDRLAVGAPGEGGGTVTLFSSGTRQPLVFAPASENTRLVQGEDNVPGADEAGDQFGAALAAGDVNDDLKRDLVIGAPGEEVSGRSAAGSVTLVHGADDPDVARRWTAAGGMSLRPGSSGVPGRPSAGARFGASVASLDVNGDGYPDVVGGSPGDDTVRRNAGAAYLAFGTRSGLSGGRRVTWPGARANDNFGARLAAPHMFSTGS